MNIDEKTVTAVYSGSSVYKASRSTAVSMEYESLNVNLTVDSVTATRGSNVTFTATVKDTNANDVNDGKVIFKINGKTIKDSEGKVIYATVTNGIATANYELASNFKVKDFTLTAVYISNIYNRQTANATLTVTSTE